MHVDGQPSGIALTNDERNFIPVIARMLDILESIERRKDGISIKELCDQLRAPRSTVYRILNTLEARDVVKRTDGGAYVLGPRLLGFAAHVTSVRGPEIASIVAPHLDRLALMTGQSVKLSVVYGKHALVVGCSQGTHEYALIVRLGRTVPLHTGAASKILLAHMSSKEREEILSGRLVTLTSRTIVDPDQLRRELDEVRDRGWATDQGEHGEGVHAIAAPVRDENGDVLAAISIPYLGVYTPSDLSSIRGMLLNAAEGASAELRAHRLGSTAAS